MSDIFAVIFCVTVKSKNLFSNFEKVTFKDLWGQTSNYEIFFLWDVEELTSLKNNVNNCP